MDPTFGGSANPPAHITKVGELGGDDEGSSPTKRQEGGYINQLPHYEHKSVTENLMPEHRSAFPCQRDRCKRDPIMIVQCNGAMRQRIMVDVATLQRYDWLTNNLIMRCGEAGAAIQSWKQCKCNIQPDVVKGERRGDIGERGFFPPHYART